MNSTEVFLLQELQVFINADSIGLPAKFTGTHMVIASLGALLKGTTFQT